MASIRILENTIQEYAWGSFTAIPGLLGRTSPAEMPQAELWMGAHPKAPSKVVCDGRSESLIDWIARDPERVLGKSVAETFGSRLPFLFKVLAAAAPLSIQAHPDRENACRGFAAENRRGIPLSAPERNYRDDNHKPECLCALTPFAALIGFRSVAQIRAYLTRCAAEPLAGALRGLVQPPASEGLKRFFSNLMALDDGQRQTAVRSAVQAAKTLEKSDAAFSWLLSLQRAYPDDIGVLAPLFLNLVELEPGQALYLGAGDLHAYLEGMGIELMANSDNVLRGGLTPKHIDTAELVRVLDFREKAPEILRPQQQDGGVWAYETPAAEFSLSVIRLSPQSDYVSPSNRSVEIFLCTEGAAVITDVKRSESLSVSRGTSVLVPAAVAQYRLTGSAVLYRASVPTG